MTKANGQPGWQAYQEALQRAKHTPTLHPYRPHRLGGTCELCGRQKRAHLGLLRRALSYFLPGLD